MKRFPKLVFLCTFLWMAILAYFAFFTEVSQSMLYIIYFVGQSFLTAAVITQWKSCKKMKPVN